MSKKAFDYELSDPALSAYLGECEAKLRFPEFNADIAYKLGEFLRNRFVNTHDASEALYIQIRGFPARTGSPFVLFAALAGNFEKISAGVAYQVDSKSRVVEHHGSSTLAAKAFAAMMGWDPEKMGLYKPDYVVNGGGFPIRLTNCPTPVGAIIASGMPDVKDHQFIVDSLEEFLPTLSKSST